MNKFKILSLLILLSISFKPIYLELQSEQSIQEDENFKLKPDTTSRLTQIKDFLKDIPNKVKNYLSILNVDTPVLDLTVQIPGGRGATGFQVPIGVGITEIDRGFNPAPINLISPSISELQIPGLNKFLTVVPDLANTRFFNLLLGVNLTPNEKRVYDAKLIQNMVVPIRNLMNPVFEKLEPLFYVENGVAYLKPVHVAGIKLALLIKTYAKEPKKLGMELPLFFAKFLNTADWDASMALSENVGKPWIQWKLVTYSDPAILDKLIPQFIKDIIDSFPINISMSEYLAIQDGTSDYLSNMTVIWRRGSVDSKAFYFINNIVSLFDSAKMNPTEIIKTAVAIATMYNDLDKATVPEATKERLVSIIDDFILKLKKVSLVGPLSIWKNSIEKNMESLKSNISSNKISHFDISALDITSDKKLTTLELLVYYKKKVNNFLNYKHLGEQGAVFDFSEITQSQALADVLQMTYRLYKDTKVAMAKASQLTTDTQFTVDEKIIKIGPQSYKQRIGEPGIYNPRTRKFDKQGSGLIWAEQMAKVELDSKIVVFNNLKSRGVSEAAMQYKQALDAVNKSKRAYVIARDKTKEARAKYAFDVVRTIEIEMLGITKTAYGAFLGDLNVLLRRVDKVKPIIESIKEFYEAVGLPFPTVEIEEDVEQSALPFDNSFFEEESGFSTYDPFASDFSMMGF